MKIRIVKNVKRYASCAGILFLAACAQNSGGGEAQSCADPQQLSSAFEQVAAQVDFKEQNGKFQLLVKMTNMGLDFESLKSMLRNATTEAELKIKKINADTVLIEFAKGSPAQAVIEKFIEERRISHLEADQETFSFESVEDGTPIAEMEMPSEPRAMASGPQIIVAIIDSGVDYTHKDLAPYMWQNPGEVAGNGVDDDHNGFVDDVNGWDFVNEDNKPMADDTRSYHGTHVAGIVKTASQLSGTGVNLKIMALKYLNSSGSGRTSNAIRAIDYAIKNGAIILNNSWGSFGNSSALSDAIERARQASVLFMAASGNGDSSGVGVNIDRSPFYPAAYAHSNVISVAASNDSGILAGWSNYGANNVDLAAPGVSILSARNGNTYARLTGTSMATPYVSGVAALLWAKRPDLSANEIRKILFSSVTSGSSFAGKMTTGGNINWSVASQIAGQYQHDPNDKGIPGITPNSQCGLP